MMQKISTISTMLSTVYSNEQNKALKLKELCRQYEMLTKCNYDNCVKEFNYKNKLLKIKNNEQILSKFSTIHI